MTRHTEPAAGEVEPLCDPRRAQDCIFPLDPKTETIWQNFKDAYACYWSPTTGADYTKEAESWAQLDEPKQVFLMNLLAFFAGADGVSVGAARAAGAARV